MNRVEDRRSVAENTGSRRLPSGVLYEAEESKETYVPSVPGGYVFICSHGTERECFERNLFAMPMSDWNWVSQVRKGDILFLLNYQSNRLYGVFEATTDGMLNIEPSAFNGYFSAQVRVRRKMRCPSLDEAAFLPLIRRGWIKVSRRGVLVFPRWVGPAFIDELWRLFLEVPPMDRAKTGLVGYKAKDGHITNSYGERFLDDWLHEHLPYKHEYNHRVQRAKREVLCDWYIPKIDLHIEFWEKKAKGDPRAIEIKQKFYEDHSLKAIDIYENDLQTADRTIPARIRQVAPKCKFKNLVKETG